jgi:hypothetical protein
MNRLLTNANIDYPRLKRYISKVAATELMKLTEPCYIPKLKVHYYEILKLCKLNESTVKNFVKEYYKGTPASRWKLQNDPITNLLICIMFYFLNKNDISGFRFTMVLFIVRYYTNLITRHLPNYCDQDTFRYTLEHLTKTHLFIREKSIPGGLFHLSKELEKRYKDKIKRGDVDDIAKFITESRHRVEQSVISFAEYYYRSNKEGKGSSIQTEPSDTEDTSLIYQSPQKGEKVINDVVKYITLYKSTDQKAYNKAREITKLNTSICTIIINQLKDLKYSDSIKNSLNGFIRNLTTIDMLCGNDFFIYVQKLMVIRSSKNISILFRREIDNIIKRMKTDSNILKSMSQSFDRSSSLFLALYITLILRNRTCPS